MRYPSNCRVGNSWKYASMKCAGMVLITGVIIENVLKRRVSTVIQSSTVSSNSLLKLD